MNNQKILDIVDNHLFMSNTPGYFWFIKNNIIFGVATLKGLPFSVNKTYIKNMIKENADNFCSIDLYEFKRNMLNTNLVHIKDNDSEETKINKIENWFASHERRISQDKLEYKKFSNDQSSKISDFFVSLNDITTEISNN